MILHIKNKLGSFRLADKIEDNKTSVYNMFRLNNSDIAVGKFYSYINGKYEIRMFNTTSIVELRECDFNLEDNI